MDVVNIRHELTSCCNPKCFVLCSLDLLDARGDGVTSTCTSLLFQDLHSDGDRSDPEDLVVDDPNEVNVSMSDAGDVRRGGGAPTLHFIDDTL